MLCKMVVRIKAEEGSLHISGPRGELSDGEWGIVIIDYLRQVAGVLSHAFPGRYPEKDEMFEMLCDMVRNKWSDRTQNHEDEQGLDVIYLTQLDDAHALEIRLRALPLPLQAWAQLAVDICNYIHITDEDEFQEAFDAEADNPTAPMLIKRMPL